MKRALRSLFAFCLVASFAVWALLHSSYVQEPLKKWASEAVFNATGKHLTIEKFTFSLPAQLKIHQPVVGNPVSPGFTAEKVILLFSPYDLANGLYTPKRVVVQEGKVGRAQQLSTFDIDLEIATASPQKVVANTILYPGENSQFPIPYEISTEILWEEGGPLILDNIEGHIPGFALAGALAIDPADKGIDGELHLFSQDNAKSDKWLPIPIQGTIEAKLHFDSRSESPITFDVQSEALQSEGVYCQSCSIKGGLTTPLSVALRGLEVGSLNIEELNLVTDHSSTVRSNHYELDAKGFAGEGVAITSTSRGSWFADQDHQVVNIDIQTFEGSLSNTPYHILHPAMLVLSKERLALADWVFSIAHTTLSCDIGLNNTTKELLGNIKAKTELSEILQLFPDPPTLSGITEGEFSLSGTLENPILKGLCQVKEGSFAITKLGTLIHNLSGTITVDNNIVSLVDAKGNDGVKGSAAATGYILLDISKNLPFQLNITFAQMAILDQDYAKAAFNGACTLAGDLSSAKLTGKGSCSEGIITVPDKPKAALEHVDVIYVNHPEGQAKPQAQSITPPGTLWPITFDLALDFPKNLRIFGTDLSSTWKGEIAVKGNQSTPLLQGELKLVDGKYSFNGNPLKLKEGTITINGDVEKKLNLYIIANRDLDDVDIDIIVKGPAKNPEVSFRSKPPMPQREILSWLLFNTGTSDISPFQGSQLTESITNLNSAGKQGPDVLTKLRSSLGIDRLEIGRCGTGADSQVSVKVGKYITDNLLICVNKREVNSVAIEAAISKKFKLQAQVSDDAQGQLMLKWKKDY